MNYSKAILAVVATVLAALVPAVTGGISTAEWLNVVVLGAGAAAVFAAPNVPFAPITKAVLAVVTAAATALVTFVGAGGFDNVSSGQWLQLGVVVLAAVGVFSVPNRPAVKQA